MAPNICAMFLYYVFLWSCILTKDNYKIKIAINSEKNVKEALHSAMLRIAKI